MTPIVRPSMDKGAPRSDLRPLRRRIGLAMSSWSRSSKTSGRVWAAMRPAMPWPTGIRIPSVTSSSRPSAAVTATSRPSSVRRRMTTVSASSTSRTRAISSRKRSSSLRLARAMSVTRWSARRRWAERSASARAGCSRTTRRSARRRAVRSPAASEVMISASATKMASRARSVGLRSGISQFAGTRATVPARAPRKVATRPGPSPPYQALSITAPRNHGRSDGSISEASRSERSHAPALAPTATPYRARRESASWATGVGVLPDPPGTSLGYSARMSSPMIHKDMAEHPGPDGFSYVDARRLREALPTARDSYGSAAPFPHTVIDDFLRPEVAQELEAQFPKPDHRIWKHHLHLNAHKFACNRLDAMPPLFRAVLQELNARPVLEFLEALTG